MVKLSHSTVDARTSVPMGVHFVKLRQGFILRPGVGCVRLGLSLTGSRKGNNFCWTRRPQQTYETSMDASVIASFHEKVVQKPEVRGSVALL